MMMTDERYALADKLEAVLESAGAAGVTPSVAGRAAGVTTDEASLILRWLVRERFAHTSGVRSRTRYHAGRG